MADGEEQPTGGETGEAQPGQVRLVVPAQLPEDPPLYSNYAHASMSPHEITLHFGWYAIPPVMAGPPPSMEIPVRPLTSIAVPLSLVPGLIDALQKTVENWKGNFGQPFPVDPTRPDLVPE